MTENKTNRSFFQRLFGIPATKKPADSTAWSYAEGILQVDIAKTPELSADGGSVSIEDPALPDRVLVFKGKNGSFHAYSNRCKHAGRRLDPVPGENQIQCCSISRTLYTYDGSIVEGPAKGSLKKYEVEERDNKIKIQLV